MRVAPPWSRAVFWMSTSLVITAVIMAFLFDVEQTGFARGILRVAGAKITREPGPVKGGTTVIAFVEDPDGYKIELIAKKDAGTGLGDSI